MTENLNVLVVESDPGGGDSARDALRAAGHTVLRCHTNGEHAFPCNALTEGERCPFDEHVVDVVVDVRRRPRPDPSPFEDGVRCGLQRHVPLVVAGRVVANPYESYATEVVVGDEKIVDACERAAAAPLAKHSEAARVALGDVLRRRELAGDGFDVQVFRRQGVLLVEADAGAELDHTTKSVASARMIGALREVDESARGIDVCFAERPAPVS
jgi:hypothetical protein